MVVLVGTSRRHDLLEEEDRGAATWPVLVCSGLVHIVMLLVVGALFGERLMKVVNNPLDVKRYYGDIWYQLTAYGMILAAQFLSTAITAKLAQRRLQEK